MTDSIQKIITDIIDRTLDEETGFVGVAEIAAAVVSELGLVEERLNGPVPYRRYGTPWMPEEAK